MNAKLSRVLHQPVEIWSDHSMTSDITSLPPLNFMHASFIYVCLLSLNKMNSLHVNLKLSEGIGLSQAAEWIICAV